MAKIERQMHSQWQGESPCVRVLLEPSNRRWPWRLIPVPRPVLNGVDIARPVSQQQ